MPTVFFSSKNEKLDRLEHFGVAATDVSITANLVRAGTHELPLDEFLQFAYRARISLAATGFYATPKIHYDRKTFSGRPCRLAVRRTHDALPACPPSGPVHQIFTPAHRYDPYVGIGSGRL